MKATLGRIVHYVLSAADVERIDRSCNQVCAGCECAVIVVFGEDEGVHAGINLKVLLDGHDALWVSRVQQDDGLPPLALGTWHWPEREPLQEQGVG